MTEKRYAVNEIFYSLQGEGVRAGTPNVFLRFAGCNMTCDLEPSPRSPGGFICDTEFRSHRLLTAGEIVQTCQDLGGTCRWVICTGGEPTLQLDTFLATLLHEAGYKLAIETNGTRPVPLDIDWVCVSPKVAEHALKQRTAHEVKYVRHAGQGLPRPVIRADHYLLSPAFEPDGTVTEETVRWCANLCKDHPPWRLSLQLHKVLKIR